MPANDFPRSSTFVLAIKKLRVRVKAAAQHSSSELSSAFTLHFTYHCYSGWHFNYYIFKLLNFTYGTLHFAANQNLNVIFLFCREINGEKKNFCLVTNPRKKLKYSMFSEAES